MKKAKEKKIVKKQEHVKGIVLVSSHTHTHTHTKGGNKRDQQQNPVEMDDFALELDNSFFFFYPPNSRAQILIMH